MKFLLEFKLYTDKIFWKDVDDTVTKMINDSNFYPFWGIKEKIPRCYKR
jgi:hypothetical protein